MLAGGAHARTPCCPVYGCSRRRTLHHHPSVRDSPSSRVEIEPLYCVESAVYPEHGAAIRSPRLRCKKGE